MTMKLVLSLVLVVGAAAYSWGCCTPDQWEGYQTATAGFAFGERMKGTTKKFSVVHYDATNKRAAVFATHIARGHERRYQIVTRHEMDDDVCDKTKGEGKMYFIDLKKDKCFTKTIKGGFRKLCVPPTKEKGHEFSLGLKDQFKCRGFEVKKQLKRGDIKGYVTVFDLKKAEKDEKNEKDENAGVCVPVGVQLEGRMRGGGFMETIAFLDITSGIKNATVFDVPKICDEEVDVRHMEDAPEREHYVMAL